MSITKAITPTITSLPYELNALEPYISKETFGISLWQTPSSLCNQAKHLNPRYRI